MRRDDFLARARADNDGVASLVFARSCGVEERAFQRWFEDRPAIPGRPRGVHHLEDRPDARATLRAALDALGTGAALGGRSALWAWGLARTPRPLEVVAPHARRSRGPGEVRVRRTRTLLDTDIVSTRGWPVTSPERTVLDVGVDLNDDPRLALVIDAAFHGLLTPASMRGRVDATPTAVGTRKLTRTLDALGDARPDSIFEWWVRRHLERVGVRVQGPVDVTLPEGTFSVDLVVVGRRIAIECDGSTHLESDQKARDDLKVNALSLAGWLPLKVSFTTFRRDPATFVGTVLRAIATTDRA